MRFGSCLLLTTVVLTMSLSALGQVAPTEGEKPATAEEPGVAQEPGAEVKAPVVEPPRRPSTAAQSFDREEPRRVAPPAVDPEQPEQDGDKTDTPAAGFFMKLSVPLGTGGLLSPFVSPALTNYPSITFGGISSSGVGGGLGVAFAHFGDDNDSEFLVSFAPTFTYVHPGLAGGKVRLSVTGAPLLGFTNISDGGLVAGYLAGLGAMFFPHPSFGVGVEGGFHGMYVSDDELWINTIFGGLTAMVIL